jgi:prevent-host-death family protein
MDISVTEFKQRCLELVRLVERTGRPVTITRRGKVVAHLEPSTPTSRAGQAPWERLRALGGVLAASPGESVVGEAEFEALR